MAKQRLDTNGHSMDKSLEQIRKEGLGQKRKVVENHLDAVEKRWFAVYTAPKGEKMAVENLRKKGIEAYTPLVKTVKKYKSKTKKLELPLITCYIFVNIVKKEHVTVLETELVFNFVTFSGNLLAIPDDEIMWLKRILNESIEIDLTDRKFKAGDEVEVVKGSLTGLRGRLVKEEGKERFVVEFKVINKDLRVNVDIANLRLISNSQPQAAK